MKKGCFIPLFKWTLDDFILPDTFEELMGQQQEQPQQQPVQATGSAPGKSVQNVYTGRGGKKRHDRNDDCPNRDVFKVYRKSMPNPTTNPHHESTTGKTKV